VINLVLHAKIQHIVKFVDKDIIYLNQVHVKSMPAVLLVVIYVILIKNVSNVLMNIQ
jgi:hypothetical protein